MKFRIAMVFFVLLVAFVTPSSCSSRTSQVLAAPASQAGTISASPAEEAPPWGDADVRVANDDTNGTQHAAWFDYTHSWIWYTWRVNDSNCRWMVPEPIGSLGSADFSMVAHNGWVMIAFTREFGAEKNREAFSVVKPSRWQTWSLPTNMSHTSGETRHVRLAVSYDGVPVATWSDNTSGYWLAYFASWDGNFWSARPVPSARGVDPTIATDPWSIYLVYEADWGIVITGRQDGFWEPIYTVSLDGALHPRNPELVTNPAGGVWIFWVQGTEEASEVWQAWAYFYEGHIRLTYPGQAPMPSPTPTPTPAPDPTPCPPALPEQVFFPTVIGR